MPVPSTPTNFAATPIAYGNLLNWSAQAGIDHFDVYRATAADHSGEALIATVDDSIISYIDAAATPGTHYYYRLDASSDADGESTKVAADAIAGGAGMTLTTARAWVKEYARGGGSATQYSNTDIDRALIHVCEQFLRKTRSVQVAATVALAASSPAFDVSALSLFRPERIIRANVLTLECELELVDWEALYEEQIRCTSTGRPKWLAFETSFATTGNVWPTPSTAYSLRLRWWQSFTTFTPGTASDASIRFNIPDDWLPPILSYGVPAQMQGNDPKYKYAQESWAKYLEFETSMMGAGSRGAKAVQRGSIRGADPGRWR